MVNNSGNLLATKSTILLVAFARQCPRKKVDLKLKFTEPEIQGYST